jgi:hypothetical protein
MVVVRQIHEDQDLDAQFLGVLSDQIPEPLMLRRGFKEVAPSDAAGVKVVDFQVFHTSLMA